MVNGKPSPYAGSTTDGKGTGKLAYQGRPEPRSRDFVSFNQSMDTEDEALKDLQCLEVTGHLFNVKVVSETTSSEPIVEYRNLDFVQPINVEIIMEN